ncbi:MAG TPA: hypothetical protein VGE34_04680 [Candidatus Saccharimonadales bacterium]
MTVLAGLGVSTLGPPPAHAEASLVQAATTSWPPPPPDKRDLCGTSEDKYFLWEYDNLVYTDQSGNYLTQGEWLPSGGVSSIKVIAKNFSDPDVPQTITFGTEPSSSCTEALDTVRTRIVACNTVNSGTRVEFTYTNEVGGSLTRPHHNPVIQVERWDKWVGAQVNPAFGPVEDGQSISVTGGDTRGDGANEFYLTPGTYTMELSTDETPARLLPNPLIVPSCDGVPMPPGDPNGGGTTPTVTKKVDITQFTAKTKRSVVVRGKTTAANQLRWMRLAVLDVSKTTRKRCAWVKPNGRLVYKAKVNRACPWTSAPKIWVTRSSGWAKKVNGPRGHRLRVQVIAAWSGGTVRTDTGTVRLRR